MPNPFFQFKQFTVKQDACAMKVGTDGVLLGAWTETNNTNRILDIGTGTGLIALMLAQRSSATIEALEIDQSAFLQAKQNIIDSPWSNRIAVAHGALQTYSPEEKFDLIVSNPPYFVNSLNSPSISRTQARHNNSLTSEDIITGCRRLLLPEGKLCLILPLDEGIQFIEKAKSAGLFCQRKTAVIPKKDAAVKRLLLSFGYEEVSTIVSELQIETDSRHKYSNEYIQLTKDYYLNF